MIDAIKAVLDSTTDQLIDLEYVEALIKRFGLYYDIRDIYGEPYNQWMIKNYMGGMYQQPRQIAQSLIYLHDKGIKSYLEIGTFYGYTFAFVTAYLSKFGLELAIAFDSNSYFNMYEQVEESMPSVFMNYIARHGPIEINGHKGWIKILEGNKYDLVFIDGNHAYSAVKEDYENVGKYARFCAIHDINDMYIEDECEGGGPVQFWKELEEKRHIENQQELIKKMAELINYGSTAFPLENMKVFTYHPENKRVMGIGIIQPGAVT
jgi:Methyltransferase domain